MRIFVDTSAFYAYLDRDDKNHQKAKNQFMEIFSNSPDLATSNYVLVETFALLQNRLGLEAVREFQTDIVPLLKVGYVLQDLHRTALSAFLSAGRRGLSFVDCVSFEMMRDLGIKSALTFDAHFQEQGFDILP
jgi:predicted nucleic acid-binding protein